jgi:hypothetical protein
VDNIDEKVEINMDEKVQEVLLLAKNTEVFPDPKNDLSPLILQFNEWKSSAIDQIM